MGRKLSAAQGAQMHDAFLRGTPVSELAAEYNVTERHTRRLTADVVSSKELEAGNVEDAVRRFLDGLESFELDGRNAVVAETCLQLARKLGRGDPRSPAGLAARLIDLVDDLLWRTRAPDRLDELVAARAKRLRSRSDEY
jgi:hypothetical protein